MGHTSAIFQVSIDLQATQPLPPSNLHLIASDLTGSSTSTTKDRSLTVELSAQPGTLVTLYENGVPLGQQTATSSPLDFVIPGSLADGSYLFTATAETLSGLTSPFSNPFTATVDNSPPAITSFSLDSQFQTQPYGHNMTVMQMVRLDGQTVAGASVKLLETGATATADSSGDFSFYPVNLPNLGRYTFTVEATDVAGNTATLPKTFMRISDILATNLIPPDVTLNISTTTARVGDTVTFTMPTQTHDGQPLASEVLLINGSQVPISASGTATLSSLTTSPIGRPSIRICPSKLESQSNLRWNPEIPTGLRQ